LAINLFLFHEYKHFVGWVTKEGLEETEKNLEKTKFYADWVSWRGKKNRLVGTEDLLEVLVNDGLDDGYFHFRGLFEFFHFHEIARVNAFGNGKFQLLAFRVGKHRVLVTGNFISGFDERIHGRHILTAPRGIWELFFPPVIKDGLVETPWNKDFQGLKEVE
jgi:hypothetical protein